MVKKQWGAAGSDWDKFLSIGMLPDLLPVVSNLEAKISPNSKMVGTGKTPSVYNRSGLVAGMPKWTEREASAQQVDTWRNQPDYGICLQTRNVRALDVDVDDKAKAQDIVDFLQDSLLYAPVRFRRNSGKCLIGVRVEGILAKRILKVDGGIIEFLGNGQQFIAAGTHTSGVPYVWNWNNNKDFPSMPLADFEAMWAQLVEKFGIEKEVRRGVNRKQGDIVVLHDETVISLDDLGLPLGEGNEGQMYIECPWKDGHSSDTGIAQTAYFPKGTRGYEQGHFHCLHASCAHRTDGDFLEALGVSEAQFEVLPAVMDKATGEEKKPMPPLMRDSKGEIKALTHNVNAVLSRSDVTGLRLKFDTFRDEIMWAQHGSEKWVAFLDEHNTELRIRFDRVGFKPVSKDLMRDCVHHVSVQNKFDSAITWLEGLKWDGVPRVNRFAADYLSAADNDYSVAVSRYLWTALAGRIMEPGVKADMVPILVGEQAARKSTAVAWLAPEPEFFTEISLSENDADLARRMRGRMVGEIAELQGLRTRELEAIKAFVTRQYEDWVPKYKEFATSYARRLLFIGTSNEDQFLSDQTGNRRWLPMQVVKCDTNAIKRDRNQLWAEAREMFVKGGVDHESAEALGSSEHEKFRTIDAWEDVVSAWLTTEEMDGKVQGDAAFLRNADILQGALHMAGDRMRRADEMRLSSVMPQLGYEKVRKAVDGRRLCVWVKTPSASVLY